MQLTIKKITFILLVFILPHGLFSLPLSQYVDEKTLIALKENGTATSTQFHEKAINRIFLINSQFSTTIDTVLKNLKPNITVEKLFFFDTNKEHPQNEVLFLYNTITKISSLKGITYWSDSRNGRFIFYEDSYRIDSKEKKNKVTDTTLLSLPNISSFYVEQKDTTFGKNIYQFNTQTNKDSLFINIQNETGLWIGFIKLIDEKKFNTMMIIQSTDEGILLYFVSTAQAFILPGIESKIESSFSNRADALINWFIGQIKTFYN